MNRLDVKSTKRQSPERGTYVELELYVDGRPLVEMVREFESSFAGDLAGSYESNVAHACTGDFLLGKQSTCADDAGKTDLLDCTCGCMGCWPLAARIKVNDQTVTWDAFEQPHRDWCYDGFGPFEFDLNQYRGAVAGISR